MPISSTSRVQLSPDSSLKTRRASTPLSTSSVSAISSTGSKIFSAPLPKYEVKSKVGSRDNIRHKPQGGHVKIHNEMPKWNAQAKIPTKAEAAAAKKKDEMAPPTPKRRVTGNKLDLSKVTSKVGSLDNVRKSSRSGNGDEKSSASSQMEGPKKPSKRISQHIIPNQKLDFSKVTSKVGSKDNIRHKPGGGQNKIFDQKLEWQAEAKIPKPDRMSSLTRRLAEVSVKDKPKNSNKLEEDARTNPFLSEVPEQLKQEHQVIDNPSLVGELGPLKQEDQVTDTPSIIDEPEQPKQEYQLQEHDMDSHNQDIEVS
ncbi:unnamed protein product [Umbelopsis vinacea]